MTSHAICVILISESEVGIMLNTYLVKFQRKIGVNDWETTLTNYSIIEDDRQEWIEEKASMMPMSEINNYTLSESTLRDAFNIYRTERKWYDTFYRKGYSYKRINPYVSLRIKYEKVTISMERLFKMDSDKVIQYLFERGINKI